VCSAPGPPLETIVHEFKTMMQIFILQSPQLCEEKIHPDRFHRSSGKT
jgi:hypothetical protein